MTAPPRATLAEVREREVVAAGAGEEKVVRLEVAVREPDPAERDHRVQELGKVARDLARGDTVILAEK